MVTGASPSMVASELPGLCVEVFAVVTDTGVLGTGGVEAWGGGLTLGMEDCTGVESGAVEIGSGVDVAVGSKVDCTCAVVDVAGLFVIAFVP